MLSNKKSVIEPYLEPIVDRLSHINPNTLTLLGSIPPLLFFVFLILHWYFWAIIALFASLSDMLDGMVARKYNKVTAFGGLLDSTVDRVSNFFVITAFAFSDMVSWSIVAPLLLFAYLTSYIRAQGGVRSKNDPANFASGVGLIEHSERIIWIIVTVLLYLFLPKISIHGVNIVGISFIVLTLLSFYTVIQRIIYAYKNL
jgi:archaetidylinositol phosphate synthase